MIEGRLVLRETAVSVVAFAVSRTLIVTVPPPVIEPLAETDFSAGAAETPVGSPDHQTAVIRARTRAHGARRTRIQV
jgi:hypothetical protein